MKKKELIDNISKKAGLAKKDAEAALQAVVGSITDLLAQGDSIVLPGFVSISVKKRAARQGRNPSTGAPLNIAARNIVSFKAGSKLKDAIND
ncbi:MAG: HU family DNA-binding protein [Gammaproteobacteria bacterium]|nr:HU family DNA-binding protein [Gammaproteobacteria bacterium]